MFESGEETATLTPILTVGRQGGGTLRLVRADLSRAEMIALVEDLMGRAVHILEDGYRVHGYDDVIGTDLHAVKGIARWRRR